LSPFLHRAGITGAQCPIFKCVHRFLKKCFYLQGRESSFPFEKVNALKMALLSSWEAISSLNPILSENYAKTKTRRSSDFCHKLPLSMQIKTLPTLSNFGAIFWCHFVFYNVKIILVPGSKILLKHCMKLRIYSWTSKNSEPSTLHEPLKMLSLIKFNIQDHHCCIEFKWCCQ